MKLMEKKDIKSDDQKSIKDDEEQNSLSEEIETKKEEENPENKLKIVEEKLLRTMAEMENQRRRFEKERQDAFDFGGFNFAKESLSLLDNIDRAILSFKNDNTLPSKSKEIEKIIDGIEIVKQDLVSIFKKNGVEAIECLNKKFDPNFHQAMLEVEDNSQKPGTVVQEIQKGYMMKTRLLRPSLVGVTKKRAEKNEKNTNKEIKNDQKD